MRPSIGGHLRHNAIAYAALFVALSGTAWAAGKIGANDIKPDAVRAKHIKDGQVLSPEVGDNSLTGADIDETSLQGLAATPVGPAGGDLTASYPNPQVGANTIGPNEITNSAVGSSEVVDGALTGGDIDEATLELPTVAAADVQGSCDPVVDEGFETCATTTFTPAQSRTMLVVASLGWQSDSGGGAGVCSLFRGNTQLDTATPGETSDTTGNAHQSETTIVALAPVTGGQDTTLRVTCIETESDLLVHDAELAAIG